MTLFGLHWLWGGTSDEDVAAATAALRRAADENVEAQREGEAARKTMLDITECAIKALGGHKNGEAK